MCDWCPIQTHLHTVGMENSACQAALIHFWGYLWINMLFGMWYTGNVHWSCHYCGLPFLIKQDCAFHNVGLNQESYFRVMLLFRMCHLFIYSYHDLPWSNQSILICVEIYVGLYVMISLPVKGNNLIKSDMLYFFLILKQMCNRCQLGIFRFRV